MVSTAPEKPKNEMEFMELARTRFKDIYDYEAEARRSMEEDLLFAYRDQWRPVDREKRDGEKRPAITIRRSKQFIDHIKNEERQNKPQIKVSPVDDGAQEEYAKKRQGLIRHIQYESKASQAYQRAYDFSVDMGRGWFRVNVAFVHQKTTDLKLVIEPLRDQFSVYMESKHEEADYSDCRWGFVTKKLARKEYDIEYPDADPCTFTTDEKNVWIEKDFITLAEYYVKVSKKRTLWKVQMGDTTEFMWKDEDDNAEKHKDMVIDEREVDDDYIHWYLLNGKEVLEDMETVFSHIPLVPIIGEETLINGKYDLKGVTRDLVGPGRLYNFLASQETELVSNAPKALFMGAVGQFESLGHQYENVNDSSTAFIEYNPVSHDGNLVPPPNRVDQVPIPAGITTAKQEAIADMQAITGYFNAQAGDASNETSGIAIRQRINQGNTASYHFVDNGNLAYTHAGKIINAAIPKIYSEGRTVTILGEDDEESQFTVGEKQSDGKVQGFGSGEFSVVVSVGPSYNTKREEAAANMIETAKAVPLIGQSSPDLMVKAQDWPLKDEIAERNKRFIEMQYPGLTAPIIEEGDNSELAQMAKELEDLQGQLQQMSQEREQLTQQLQKIDLEKEHTKAMQVQKDLKDLDIKAEALVIEGKKIKADLSKADLSASTDIEKAKLNSKTTIQVEKMRIKGKKDVEEENKTDSKDVANERKEDD